VRTRTILHVAGVRPNYVKVAPLIDALQATSAIRQVLVNTGQHYRRRVQAQRFAEVVTAAADGRAGRR